MSGRYGMSFASELNEQGKHEEAIVEATKAIAGGDTGPEPFLDRATAHDVLGHGAEAVADFERAIDLNGTAKCLDTSMLDDAYFSALIAAAKEDVERSVDDAVARVDRYTALLPNGRHARDAEQWRKRLKGELVSLLDKTTEMGAP